MWANLILGVEQPLPGNEALSTGNLLAISLMMMVLFLSVYLWLGWIVRWIKGKPSPQPLCFQRAKRNYPVEIPSAPIFLASFWIAVQLLLTFYKPPQADQPMPEFNFLLINLVVIPAGIGLFLLALWEFSTAKSHLGDYFHLRNWREELQAGAEIMLLTLPLTILLGIVSLLWKTPDQQHLLLQILRSEQDWQLVLLIIFTAALFAPLLEELLFRVLLLNGLILRGHLPRGLAVVVVSIIFSLAHGLYDAVQLMPLSLALGYCLVQRQSYLAVVTGHALFNGLMLSMALLQTPAAN